MHNQSIYIFEEKACMMLFCKEMSFPTTYLLWLQNMGRWVNRKKIKLQVSDLVHPGKRDSVIEMLGVLVRMYPCKGNLEEQVQTFKFSNLIKASS